MGVRVGGEDDDVGDNETHNQSRPWKMGIKSPIGGSEKGSRFMDNNCN